MLLVDAEQIDSVRFERAVADARGGMPTERAATGSPPRSRSGGAQRSPTSPSIRGRENESRRLDELRLTAIEERIDAELELGRDRELVPELEALVAANSMRERLRGQLMLALYRSGRQAEALTAYQQARRALVEGLGIEPGPELQRLHASILRQEAPLEAHPAEDLTDDHYDDVVRALHDGRLVVVLGFGVNLADRPSDATWSAHDPTLSANRRRRGCLPRASVRRPARPLARPRPGLAVRRPDEGRRAAVRRAARRLRPRLPAGPVHTFAVELPAIGPRQPARRIRSLVTTHYDQTLERAFAEAGEEVDVVCYVAAGRDRGKFLHFGPTARRRSSRCRTRTPS